MSPLHKLSEKRDVCVRTILCNNNKIKNLVFLEKCCPEQCIHKTNPSLELFHTSNFLIKPSKQNLEKKNHSTFSKENGGINYYLNISYILHNDKELHMYQLNDSSRKDT